MRTSDIVREAKAVAKQLANLTAGFKGRNPNRLLISIEGGTREPFVLKITRQLTDLEQKVEVTTLNLTRLMARTAERNFRFGRGGIKRPQEQGFRPQARMTGRFTFGGPGSAFKAVSLDNKDTGVRGFGYPDIVQADRRTKFVWRSLEFGLGSKGENDPEGPIGQHLLPLRFRFDKQNRFVPSKGRKDSRNPAVRRGAGFEAKHFIRDAAVEVAGIAGKEYRKAAAETYRTS